MEWFAKQAGLHELIDRVDHTDDQLDRYLYSPDMTYRYAFGRWWGQEAPATTDVWVLLNPATGDTERRTRPTLTRCITRSKTDTRTGLLILNLFAFRHTDPGQLRGCPDPVGPANDEILQAFTTAAGRTIVAWGAGGRLAGRSRAVATHLDHPLCLGTTSRGEPRHPLYVTAAAELRPWHPPAPPHP